jgi:plasmid stabilization system protein ParE
MRLIYHPDAEVELIEAAQYYERRVATLGVQLLNEADQTVSISLSAPERWKIISEDVRRCLMLRFPYAIYYRSTPDCIRILAFKHHSRHLDYWQYRISE